jgi:hypothetical protein
MRSKGRSHGGGPVSWAHSATLDHDQGLRLVALTRSSSLTRRSAAKISNSICSNPGIISRGTLVEFAAISAGSRKPTACRMSTAVTLLRLAGKTVAAWRAALTCEDAVPDQPLEHRFQLAVRPLVTTRKRFAGDRAGTAMDRDVDDSGDGLDTFAGQEKHEGFHVDQAQAATYRPGAPRHTRR